MTFQSAASGFAILLICLLGCQNQVKTSKAKTTPYVLVLGTLQDGGSPHAGCKKSCCADLFIHPDASKLVVCLSIVDPKDQSYWLIEATPDFSRQLNLAQNDLGVDSKKMPAGIFISHAHIGHYSGLMFLGKEVMSTHKTPVYAMPRMKTFLAENGPWSQLISQQNIEINGMHANDTIRLTEQLVIIPFLVPHRDEFSETVGFKIIGPNKSLLFIPDINKWNIWEKDIISEVNSVNYALLDATFYSGEEILSRDISQIPHPFVIESIDLFKTEPDSIKNRIQFIHLNHTNPLLNIRSTAFVEVEKAGFRVAKFGDKLTL